MKHSVRTFLTWYHVSVLSVFLNIFSACFLWKHPVQKRVTFKRIRDKI